MEQFSWPYHGISVRYPEGGTRVKLGGSYTLAVPPSSPDARILALRFKVLRWISNTDGTLNTTSDPGLNLGRLVAFYEDHLLWKEFSYPGFPGRTAENPLVVKFNRPLEIPEQKEGGYGAVEGTLIELIEVP
jgi:hypothetical protein